jgi:hypothetical protein
MAAQSTSATLSIPLTSTFSLYQPMQMRRPGIINTFYSN